MNLRDASEQARLGLIEARKAAFEQRVAFEEATLEADIEAINQAFGHDPDAVPLVRVPDGATVVDSGGAAMV